MIAAKSVHPAFIVHAKCVCARVTTIGDNDLVSCLAQHAWQSRSLLLCDVHDLKRSPIMKFSSKSAKLGALLVAFVSLAAAAAPASANSWRGDQSGFGYSRGTVEQVRYDGRDDHNYGRHVEYRHQMSWRDMEWAKANRHYHAHAMFHRSGERDRFAR
jgi:hypothetical protein